MLVYLGAVDGTAAIPPGARPVGSSLPLVQPFTGYRAMRLISAGVACLPKSFVSHLSSFDITGTVWRASHVLQWPVLDSLRSLYYI
jgi:hypothetical protein